MDIEFRSGMTVELVRSMASDDMAVQAAQVSSKGRNKPETVPERLIDVLVRQKHASPFEHTAFTFFVEVPMFVMREWQRHRMSSFNEMSGRYTVLPGRFYVLPEVRPVVNEGTKMRPQFVCDPGLTKLTNADLRESALGAWGKYQRLIADGVANEVARMVLTANVYTQMYWTVNARSLMNFLSLRVGQDAATAAERGLAAVPSYPQWEIEQAALLVEHEFQEQMPLTHAAFVRNGRLAP